MHVWIKIILFKYILNGLPLQPKIIASHGQVLATYFSPPPQKNHVL